MIKIEVYMYVCMCNEYVCVDVHVYSEYKCGYEEGCGAWEEGCGKYECGEVVASFPWQYTEVKEQWKLWRPDFIHHMNDVR